MYSVAPNLVFVFKILTSLFAALILLGLIIWGYFKTKNPGYIIIGASNVLFIFFQLVKVIFLFVAKANFYQINQILIYLNFLLFVILAIGVVVLILKSERKS